MESILNQVPVVDISSKSVAKDIGKACRDCGFFYIIGHGVNKDLQKDLLEMSHQFFRKPLGEKMKMEMAKGGSAWRGYFPIGGELTSGKADQKEGIYFGAELSLSDPRPMHGPNLFPDDLPEFRKTVLGYLSEMTQLGHRLMGAISLSLNLPEKYFFDHYTKDPLVLFRIFNYPPTTESQSWGVGEHTDYGVLTILKQDETSGLEVKTKSGWIAAPPIPDSFVCNIGDMLDKMTKGLYRSTPHRVRNLSKKDRLSFPFFFDPGFDVRVKPLPLSGVAVTDNKSERWDSTSVHEFQGTYGDYLLGKVSKVFPNLKKSVLD